MGTTMFNNDSLKSLGRREGKIRIKKLRSVFSPISYHFTITWWEGEEKEKV